MTASDLVMLKVEGLEKRFAGQSSPLFDGFDLELRSGEVLALVGPSGCGKTTLLNILSMLEPFDAGTLSVRGRPASTVRRGELAMGYIFQADGLLPWSSVISNALLGLHCRGEVSAPDTERAREILERFGLAGRLDSFPHQLSGGERQRVALAQNLLIDPELFLLDEPFSSLDYPTRLVLEAELLDTIRSPRRSGGARSTLIVTHDLEEAILLADRVVALGRDDRRGPARVVADVDVVGLGDRDPIASRRAPVLRELFDVLWRAIGPFALRARS